MKTLLALIILSASLSVAETVRIDVTTVNNRGETNTQEWVLSEARTDRITAAVGNNVMRFIKSSIRDQVERYEDAEDRKAGSDVIEQRRAGRESFDVESVGGRK